MPIPVGAMIGGAAAAGLDTINKQESAQLQAERDARLNDWGIDRDKRLADRQEQSDVRREGREDKRNESLLEREDKRTTAAAEREGARLSATERIANQKDATARAEIARKEAADDRRFAAMMAKIGASGSKDKDSDKPEDREVARQIQIAKEYREQGNTLMANKVMEQLFTRTTGKPPPTLAPKPGKAAPVTRSSAPVAPGVDARTTEPGDAKSIWDEETGVAKPWNAAM